MKYRINKRTGDKISEIGMGTAYVVEAEKKEAVKTVCRAFEGGINYFDLAAGDGSAFAIFGEALSDVRDKVLYQIHFGADYSKGTYGWTLNLDAIKRSVDKQLTDLKTGYIDYGFIHCQDEHYKTLEKKAADCVSCGHCNSRCPFGVNQVSRMQEITSTILASSICPRR